MIRLYFLAVFRLCCTQIKMKLLLNYFHFSSDKAKLQEDDVQEIGQYPTLRSTNPDTGTGVAFEYPSTKSAPERLVADISDVVEHFVLSHGDISYEESLGQLVNKYDIPQTPATTASFEYFDQALDSASALRILLDKLQQRLDRYGEELEQYEHSIWKQESSLKKKAEMLSRVSAVLDERNEGLDLYLCTILERKAKLDVIDALITTRLYGECRKFLASYNDVIIPYKEEVDDILQARAIDPTYIPSRRRVYLIMTHSFLEFDRFRRLKHYVASLYKVEYESYIVFLRTIDQLYEEIIRLEPDARKFEYR